MQASGASSIAATASALDNAQLALNVQTSVQRNVLDLQEGIIQKLFASLGVGSNLNLIA